MQDSTTGTYIGQKPNKWKLCWVMRGLGVGENGTGPTNRISQLLDKIMKTQNRNVHELRQLNLASKEISDQAAWPERIYNPITAMGFWQCLPFSWTTLRVKHCRHPIAVMEVVDTFRLGISN